jgi:hypothetical protein
MPTKLSALVRCSCLIHGAGANVDTNQEDKSLLKASNTLWGTVIAVSAFRGRPSAGSAMVAPAVSAASALEHFFQKGISRRM